MSIVPDPSWTTGPPDTSEFDSAHDEAERVGWAQLYELMTHEEAARLDDLDWVCEKLEAYMGTEAKTWNDIQAYLLEAAREMVGEEVLAERIVAERRMAG